ncbi:MAG: lipopolysaccharide transport periplasmic protein LptA [Nevskiales bacterium]
MRPDFRLPLLLSALIAAPVSAAPVATPAASTGAKTAPARQQPIQIEADRAEITEQSGVSVYSGRVSLKQGDLEMEGERLEIQRDGKTGDIKAVLTGKPATLRQPTEAREMVNARANRIDYNSRDKSLDLQGSAEYVRGRDRVSGQSIRYDAAAKKLLASGPNNAGGRVQIIIQPTQSRQPQ